MASCTPDRPDSREEAARQAVLNYQRVESVAMLYGDPDVLPVVVTGDWEKKKHKEVMAYVTVGYRLVVNILSAEFGAYRRLDPGRVEIEVMETWHVKPERRDGRSQLFVVKSPRTINQVYTLVQQDGRWKVAEGRYYEPWYPVPGLP